MKYPSMCKGDKILKKMYRKLAKLYELLQFEQGKFDNFSHLDFCTATGLKYDQLLKLYWNRHNFIHGN